MIIIFKIDTIPKIEIKRVFLGNCKKNLLAHLVLLCCLCGSAVYCYFYIKEISQKQDTLLYYINISGKQRFLAQRIVFLSQVAATNYVLKRNNYENFMELRFCINQLLTIHNVLRDFAVSMVVQNKDNSTLDDIYFGSGNLVVKMESFLNDANQTFILRNVEAFLENNQKLLVALEGDNGLLTSLELATLSQQFYAQNILKDSEKKISYFLYGIFLFIILEIFLLFKKSKS